jgi:hypothetical protein
MLSINKIGKTFITTIMVFKFIAYYFLIGGLSLMVMDYMVTKVAKLLDKDPFTNVERLVVLLLWPIYTFVFWYNFIKSFFGNREE